jgi:hypothetical protein
LGHSSFRFLAISGIAGATLTLVCEGFHPPKYAKQFVGKTCTIDVYDIGPGGRKISGEPIATFTATLVEGAGKLHPPYYFQGFKRTDSGPTALAGAEKHRTFTDPFDGKTYDLTYEPVWIPPHFLITVAPVPGTTEPSRTVLIPDGGPSRERYFHDIAFTVSAGGARIFDSARNPIRLDCNPQLAHNCLEAAEVMKNDHQDLVDGRGVGLKFGSACNTVNPDDIRKYGLEPESCISYLLKVLELGHAKTGAMSEWNSIKKSMKEGDGMTLAQGLQKHQWATLFCMPDTRHYRDLDWHYIHWRQHHHRDAYRAAVGKGGHHGYYQKKSIRVEELIVDYNPTLSYFKYDIPENHSAAERAANPHLGYFQVPHTTRWVAFPDGMPEIKDLNGTHIPIAEVTPAQTDKFQKLKTIDFGVINVVDGYHTALFGGGNVYEAHWDKPATDRDVYMKRDFQTWEDGYWGDGIVQVPATLWKP